MKAIIMLMLTSIIFTNTIEGQIKIKTKSLLIQDTCMSMIRIDSIEVDFIIIVDSKGYVRKQRAEILVSRYEFNSCQYFTLGSQPRKNQTFFLLNGLPVEVLLYKPKGQNYLMGNSQ